MAYLDQVYAVVQIAPTGIPTYVRLSQNENGRILHFAISGDALPAGSTVVLTGTKPDGAVYSVSGTLADNVATFNEDEQLTAVAGEWDAKVEVTNSGNLIATGRIKFVIDADPSGGNIPSDSQLDGYIAEMLSLLDAGKAEAYGSPLVASTVAGMTDQSRVYVYTGSETGYTAGNWYYWNGSAWTSGGVYNAVAVSTDTTLSIAGKAADAKATGDTLDVLRDDFTQINESAEGAKSIFTDDLITGLYYDATGIYDGNRHDYICTQNSIPVTSGNIVCMNMTSGSYGFFHVVYLKQDKSYLSYINSELRKINEYFTVTIPTNAQYMLISFTKASGETLEPNDYTLNVYDVETYIPASETLNNVSEWNGFDSYIKSLFVTHMAHSGTGTYIPFNTRNAIIEPLFFHVPIVISVESGYKFGYQTYDGYTVGQTHLLFASPWYTDSIVIPANTYFCMAVAYSNDADTDDTTQNHLSFNCNANTNDIYDRLIPVWKDYQRREKLTLNDCVVSAGFDKRPVNLELLGSLSGLQSFCKYNNKYYSTDGSNLYVQDESFTLESTTALHLGHGNAMQLGNNGLAYVSGWDDGNIYVVDLETKTITDTIILPSLSGYTTCAVDDVNKLVYIFNGGVASSGSTVFYDFVVYDYDNDTVVSTKKLTRKYGAMQSCDFVNGKIFALYGLATTSVPNGYVVFNTSGNIIAEYLIGSQSANEPEGVFIDRDTFDLYISYYNKKVYKVTT